MAEQKTCKTPKNSSNGGCSPHFCSFWIPYVKSKSKNSFCTPKKFEKRKIHVAPVNNGDSKKRMAGAILFYQIQDLKNYFFRNSLIPAAALRPSPIAKMTVAAPSTMSPPA